MPTTSTSGHSPSASASPAASREQVPAWRSPVLTAAAIAELVGGRVEGNPDVVVSGLAGVDEAGPQSLTFFRSAKFGKAWASSKAPAALVGETLEIAGHDPATRALIRVADADLAMIKVLAAFLPPMHGPAIGIHPTAIVDPAAQISPSARIGPMCVIGPHTRIGEHTTLIAHVTIGASATVGPGCTLHPGVVIYDRCELGAQVILHGNTTIGADGFGYRPDPQGRGLIKIPHIGTVKIGNGVEIGAGTCVDRGKFGATVIGDGTKIDNLCQIGHNARIGRVVVICGGAGVGGSAIIGDGVILAGHVGVSDGLTVGTKAVILAKSGVTTNVPAGETWFGTPAGPHKDQMRAFAALRKLSGHLRRFKRLERLADEKFGSGQASADSSMDKDAE